MKPLGGRFWNLCTRGQCTMVLVQDIFCMGQVPESFRQVVLVLIPKQDATNYCRRITQLETIYKLCSSIINQQMCHNVGWHDGVHGFHEGWGCMTSVIEMKLLAEKEKSEGKILYQIFLDLTKAYNTVNQECLFILLQDYTLGP